MRIPVASVLLPVLACAVESNSGTAFLKRTAAQSAIPEEAAGLGCKLGCPKNPKTPIQLAACGAASLLRESFANVTSCASATGGTNCQGPYCTWLGIPFSFLFNFGSGACVTPKLKTDVARKIANLASGAPLPGHGELLNYVTTWTSLLIRPKPSTWSLFTSFPEVTFKDLIGCVSKSDDQGTCTAGAATGNHKCEWCGGTQKMYSPAALTDMCIPRDLVEGACDMLKADDLESCPAVGGRTDIQPTGDNNNNSNDGDTKTDGDTKIDEGSELPTPTNPPAVVNPTGKKFLENGLRRIPKRHFTKVDAKMNAVQRQLDRNDRKASTSFITSDDKKSTRLTQEHINGLARRWNEFKTSLTVFNSKNTGALDLSLIHENHQTADATLTALTVDNYTATIDVFQNALNRIKEITDKVKSSNGF